jgi:hypothetical protein
MLLAVAAHGFLIPDCNDDEHLLISFMVVDFQAIRDRGFQ